MHRLAHVDVLVGRASEQGYLGLDLTVNVLAKRKGAAALQCIVAHTFAPTEGTTTAKEEELAYRKRSFKIFREHVYDKEKAETLDADADGAHLPVVIRYDVDLERFASLSPIASSLFASGFEALCKKIEERCTPKDEEE